MSFNTFFTATSPVALALSPLTPDIVENKVKTQRRSAGAGVNECSEAWDAEDRLQGGWGMLYVEDAAIVSQNPDSVGKTMEFIVKVCTISDLTVPELTTENMYSYGNFMPASNGIQPASMLWAKYTSKTNKFVCVSWGDYHRHTRYLFEDCAASGESVGPLLYYTYI